MRRIGMIVAGVTGAATLAALASALATAALVGITG
ncbi:MAG: hypothetical protein JWO36_7222 [Myxococcales bacterium]|nr:hypothetical protein [Myxococcales bacterium]